MKQKVTPIDIVTCQTVRTKTKKHLLLSVPHDIVNIGQKPGELETERK